jgi:hypothetical protein
VDELVRRNAMYERPVKPCTLCQRSANREDDRSIWRALCRATRLLAAGHAASTVATRFGLSLQDLDRVIYGHMGTSAKRLEAFYDHVFSTQRSLPSHLWPNLELEVPYRPPLDFSASLAMLRSRAAAGVESVGERSYRRVLVQTGHVGTITITDSGRSRLAISLRMDGWSGLAHVIQAARHVFNLDVDGLHAARVLADDAIIGRLVRARPGVRPPGSWDAFEAAVKAVLCCGWDVRAQDWLGVLAQRAGRPAQMLSTGHLDRFFPLAEDIARAPASDLGLPFVKAAPLHAIACAAVTARHSPTFLSRSTCGCRNWPRSRVWGR